MVTLLRPNLVTLLPPNLANFILPIFVVITVKHRCCKAASAKEKTSGHPKTKIYSSSLIPRLEQYIVPLL